MVARPNDHTERTWAARSDRYRITIPPPVRATPDELARRRENYERVMALREKVGPIGITTDELIHQARCEADGYDE